MDRRKFPRPKQDKKCPICGSFLNMAGNCLTCLDGEIKKKAAERQREIRKKK